MTAPILVSPDTRQAALAGLPRTYAASFAGRAFLANGHRPGEGPYGRAIERAMAYVKPTMASDGYLGLGDRSGCFRCRIRHGGTTPGSGVIPGLMPSCCRS